MNLLDTVMIAGICLAVGACGFLLWTQLAAPRQPDPRLENARRAERLDLYMGIVWSGFLLVQATSVFHHMQRDGTIKLPLLAWAGVAACIFICGGFAGRLLLRREMRREKERHGEPNNAAR
jgi:protein-S-isoprenylcysteine O-methyltransferase Ste14